MNPEQRGGETFEERMGLVSKQEGPESPEDQEAKKFEDDLSEAIRKQRVEREDFRLLAEKYELTPDELSTLMDDIANLEHIE